MKDQQQNRVFVPRVTLRVCVFKETGRVVHFIATFLR